MLEMAMFHDFMQPLISLIIFMPPFDALHMSVGMSVGRSVGMSVSLNLVQLVTQERFAPEASSLVGR